MAFYFNWESKSRKKCNTFYAYLRKISDHTKPFADCQVRHSFNNFAPNWKLVDACSAMQGDFDLFRPMYRAMKFVELKNVGVDIMREICDLDAYTEFLQSAFNHAVIVEGYKQNRLIRFAATA